MAKKEYQQRVAPVLKDGSKYIKSTDLADLAKYNQSQTPAPNPTVQSLTSPGRFQVDTRNGVVAARGAGPDGGSGGGGGWEGPPVEGRVQTALRQALLPQAQAPAPAAPAAQPYRETEGARVSAPARGRVQTALAQNLLGDVNGGGYSAGVLATRERQRAMQQADSLQLPPAVRAAVQDQILAGNYKAPQVAASLKAQLPTGADPGNGKVQEYLRQQLLGGDVAQAHQAKKAQDAAAYHAAAQANLAQAQQGGGYRGSSGYMGMAGVGTGSVNGHEQAMGPGLQAMGLQNGAPLGKVQEALRQALMGGSAKDLQPMAAKGNPMAAQALLGQPGPWAGGLNNGVLAREKGDQQDLYNQRYVQPAQLRADGVKTVAELKAAGYKDKDLVTLQKAQLEQQTAIYRAQLQQSGIDAQNQARLMSAYMSANGRILAAGGDIIPFNQFHQQAAQQMGTVQAPQMPTGLPPGMQAAPGQAPPVPMGAAPAPAPAPPQAAPVHPLVAQQPPWMQQKLQAGMSAQEWQKFDQMDPASQQAFLSAVASGQINP